MNDNTQSIKVSIPTDENGLVGRECPSCEGYFKVKFGTGLSIPYHICPYCSHQADSNNFFTKAQNAYMKSVIEHEIVAPMLNTFNRSLKGLETRSRNSFLQIKVKVNHISFPINTYQEKELETDVTCDNCGLMFSIYGVFSNCPDCGKLNAKTIFTKSIDVNLGKLRLSDSSELSVEIRKELLKSALIDSVSVFDSLGKVLRIKHPDKFSKKPRNLFQNIDELDKSLSMNLQQNIENILNKNSYTTLRKMFQVRHIYSHNAGVIDDEFINKLPEFARQKGKMYQLNRAALEEFLAEIKDLGLKIYDLVEK